MKTMNRQISAGVFWNVAGLILNRGASTIFMLFLARLLAPEAFGLVAMASVVFELSSVFIKSGFGTALIRSKSISDIDLDTVFLCNLALSTIAYAILFLGAPFIAAFYSQPELALLIQIMGLSVFINATTVVQTSVLCRSMNFKGQMKANIWGIIVSGILAVAAAWLGYGVWSLVVQMLAGSTVSSLILWQSSPWRPRLQFSTESFSRLFHFGRNLLAEGLLAVLYQNSYILVIGRFYSAELTGLYFFAKKLSNMIAQQLTNAVQQATFPALATLQDNNEILLQKYRQILQLMMFIIAPIMALLAALANPLFHFLFSERWLPAVPYMQLLCFVGTLYPLHALNLNLLNVKGRSDLVLNVGYIKKAVNLGLLFLAIPYGVMGIVISQIIGTTLAMIPNTYFSTHLVGYTLTAQLEDIFKPVFSASIAGFAAWLFAYQSTASPYITLLVGTLIGSVLYLLNSLATHSEGMLILKGKLKMLYLKKAKSNK